MKKSGQSPERGPRMARPPLPPLRSPPAAPRPARCNAPLQVRRRPRRYRPAPPRRAAPGTLRVPSGYPGHPPGTPRFLRAAPPRRLCSPAALLSVPLRSLVGTARASRYLRYRRASLPVPLVLPGALGHPPGTPVPPRHPRAPRPTAPAASPGAGAGAEPLPVPLVPLPGAGLRLLGTPGDPPPPARGPGTLRRGLSQHPRADPAGGGVSGRLAPRWGAIGRQLPSCPLPGTLGGLASPEHHLGGRTPLGVGSPRVQRGPQHPARGLSALGGSSASHSASGCWGECWGGHLEPLPHLWVHRASRAKRDPEVGPCAPSSPAGVGCPVGLGGFWGPGLCPSPLPAWSSTLCTRPLHRSLPPPPQCMLAPVGWHLAFPAGLGQGHGWTQGRSPAGAQRNASAAGAMSPCTFALLLLLLPVGPSRWGWGLLQVFEGDSRTAPGQPPGQSSAPPSSSSALLSVPVGHGA